MKRLVTVLVVALLSACSSARSPQPAGGQTQTTAVSASQAAGGASLVEAALKVKNVCTLLPTDLAARLVPNGAPPQSQLFPPLRCTVSNGTSVLEVTLGPYDAVDALVPNEAISGLGDGAYLQEQLVDDAYLKVLLSKDAGALYVEVAGHDGKGHKDDAIAVAQAVLAKLR